MLTGMDTERLRAIMLRPGQEAVARMPTPAEQRELDLAADTPVIEIRSAGVVTEVVPARGVTVHATG